MNNKNVKNLYLALGGLMLVLLQAPVFQNSIGLPKPIRIAFLSDLMFLVCKVLSFIGVLIFVYAAIMMIKSYFNKE